MMLGTWRLNQCERDCREQVHRSEAESRYRIVRRCITNHEVKEREIFIKSEMCLFRRFCTLFSELKSISEAAEDDAIDLFESKCRLLVKVNADLSAEAHASREVLYEQSVLAVYEAWWRSHILRDKELIARASLVASHASAFTEPLLSSFAVDATKRMYDSLLRSQAAYALEHKSSLRQLLLLCDAESRARFEICSQRISHVETLQARHEEGRRLRSLVETDKNEQRLLLIDMEVEARHLVESLEVSAWLLLGELFNRSHATSLSLATAREEYQQRVMWQRQELLSRSTLEAHADMLLFFHLNELHDARRQVILDEEKSSWELICGDAATLSVVLNIFLLEQEEQVGRSRIVTAEKLVLTFETAAAADDRIQIEISDHIVLEDDLRLQIEEEEDASFVAICLAEELSWQEAPRQSIANAEIAGRSVVEKQGIFWMSAAFIDFVPLNEYSCRDILSSLGCLELSRLQSIVAKEEEAAYREYLSAQEDEEWVCVVAPPVACWWVLARSQIEEMAERCELDECLWAEYMSSINPALEALGRRTHMQNEQGEFSAIVDNFLRGLFVSNVKYGAAAIHIREYEGLFHRALSERDEILRNSIEASRASELSALFADHQLKWHLLVALRLTFRREESARQDLIDEAAMERQTLVSAMIAAAQRIFFSQCNDFFARWRAKRLSLNSDIQDTYLAMMRDVAFELFYNHAVALAAHEEAEFSAMTQYIYSEIEFLSQFLFYGLRLSDGRFDSSTLEKTKYNCLRVVDAFPPSAPHIRPGDLVMSVNGVPSVSLKAMRKAISLLCPVATFTIARDNGQVFNVQVQGAYKAVSRAVSVTSATFEGYL